MLARCARYPAATDRTLRLFPYFYFSQYGTRSRLPFGNGSRVAPFPIFLFFSIRHPIPLTLRQRIARCAFSHISIFLNTAPDPAYPSATDRALRLFPYFYFSQYGTRARYPSATDRALRHLPELTSPSTQRLIDSNSNAHRLKFKCSSTQIQMPIDSNSKAHRLKFKGSSTQMPKNETPPGEEMRKSSGKNARHSIRVGNTSSNNIVPRSVPSG